MIAPDDQGFKYLSSFADRLNLVAKHVNPWRRVTFASQVKRLADAVSHHQTLVQVVHRLANWAHDVPLDALASLAAFAAADLALVSLEAEQSISFQLLGFVLGLLFGSGEFGRLATDWFAGNCFG